MKSRRNKIRLFILTFFLLLYTSCTAIRQPATVIHYYRLNCGTPVLYDLPPVPAQVLIKLYSGSSLLRTNDIARPAGPYRIYPSYYHKWQEIPSEMVLFCLLRNFQDSGLFQGVFGAGTVVNPKYVVEGRLDVFGEQEEKEGKTAVISVTVSLLRAVSRGDIVFQKQYVGKELLKQENPEGLAQAMSAAFERLSGPLLMDVYQRILDDTNP